MNTKKILLATLLSACLPAFADAPAEAAPRVVDRAIAVTDPHALVFAGPGGAGPMAMRDGKVIKNAPYSAEVISEKVQNLADGNQIVNRNSSKSYRDSAGRTRHEVTDSKGEVRMVTIRAADGSMYMLHPQNRTAVKMPSPRQFAQVARDAANKARERVEQLRKEGKLPAAGEDKEGGEDVIVKRVERMHGHKEMHENVRIRMQGAEGWHGANLGPMLAGAFGDMKWASKATARDLGTREFDGVKAEGKMRSYEIPAGEVGNRNPITVTQETWYSPELQVTVYTKNSDPRWGERTYRLANLKRDEPAAALFEIPSDYTLREPKMMRRDEGQKP